MDSLTLGFENDIFISYRHNDNKTLAGKGAGWVSEFVANLRLELEATLKERVNIYFDENPHNGLLETHNVDASLSAKLKALIFIPILSQTYCDPESFAWRNEFQVFNRLAAGDSFGPAIKLINGNVSNRVLPIRIHELDAPDVKLLEEELRSKLRPIDFIFKSPGVNRPLRAQEDDPLKNANHVLYRDQLNKVANAVKDIIIGSKSIGKPVEKPKPGRTVLPITEKNRIRSMAVFPFLGSGSIPDYLAAGIAEELSGLFGRVRELKTFERSLSLSATGTTSVLDVARKLGAETALEGTLGLLGDQVTVTIKISQTRDGAIVLEDTFVNSLDKLFNIAGIIVTSSLEKLDIKFNEVERSIVAQAKTKHSRAYEQYLQARYWLNRSDGGPVKSIALLHEALALDVKFASAWACLAHTHIVSGYQEPHSFDTSLSQAKESAMKALHLDSSLMEGYAALALVCMAYEWNWPEAEPYFRKVFAINSSHASAGEHYRLALKQIESSLEEAEKEPFVTMPHYLRAYSLLHRGEFSDALPAAQEAVDGAPDSFMAHRSLGLSYLGLERHDEAIEELLIAARLSNRHQLLLFELMSAYLLSGKHIEAQQVIEETMARSHVLPAKVSEFFFQV